MPASRRDPKYLILGKIVRPHGIRGEVRVRLLTDYPERIADLPLVYLGTDPYSSKTRSVELEHIRFHQDYGLIKFKNIHDRNDADLLRKQFVMIDLEHAVPLEEDEVYFYQLIGLLVRSNDGEDLGTVTEIMETGANDVYMLDSPVYGKLLIPIHEETLIKIDLGRKESSLSNSQKVSFLPTKALDYLLHWHQSFH